MVVCNMKPSQKVKRETRPYHIRETGIELPMPLSPTYRTIDNTQDLNIFNGECSQSSQQLHDAC